MMLRVRDLDFKYYGSSFELSGINIELDKGEVLAIYGFAGSGKTTLLRLLCGLESYANGSILLDSKELKELSQKDMNIGFTFDKSILKDNTLVKDAISYPMVLRGISQEQVDCYLDAVSARLDLSIQSTVKDLSPLQVALLILARLFAVERRLYLVDDIWKDLPQEQKPIVWDYILENIAGKSAIVATDDADFAKLVTHDKIVVLSCNQVPPMFSAKEIATRPINMQSAIFAGYELHIGKLDKQEHGYFASLYGNSYPVAPPIGSVYLGKEVCFAVWREGERTDKAEIGDGKVMEFYYDLRNERIISKP